MKKIKYILGIIGVALLSITFILPLTYKIKDAYDNRTRKLSS